MFFIRSNQSSCAARLQQETRDKQGDRRRGDGPPVETPQEFKEIVEVHRLLQRENKARGEKDDGKLALTGDRRNSFTALQLL